MGRAFFVRWEGVLLAAHFSWAGRGCFGRSFFRVLGAVFPGNALFARWVCVFGSAFFAGWEGVILGSALFAGWKGVLLAAHFSRAGREFVWQRIFRGLGGGVLGSALFAGILFCLFLRGERGYASYEHKRKLPKIWLALAPISG